MKKENFKLEEIKKYLKHPFEISLLSVTNSTNEDAKVLASMGAPHGTVICARKQTDGHGRNKRNFYSPDDCGIYMSIVLRTNNSDYTPARVTTLAAISVCRAISRICSKECRIKWVNDIYYRDKKVCGILAESSYSKGGLPDYIVLGIGLNVYEPEKGFPPELSGIATALYKETDITTDIRSKLCATILNEIFDNFYMDKAFLYEHYKSRLFILGREVTVIQNDKTYNARVVDLDSEYRLLVQDENADVVSLSFGEVSLKPIK